MLFVYLFIYLFYSFIYVYFFVGGIEEKKNVLVRGKNPNISHKWLFFVNVFYDEQRGSGAKASNWKQQMSPYPRIPPLVPPFTSCPISNKSEIPHKPRCPSLCIIIIASARDIAYLQYIVLTQQDLSGRQYIPQTFIWPLSSKAYPRGHIPCGVPGRQVPSGKPHGIFPFPVIYKLPYTSYAWMPACMLDGSLP